MQEKAIDEQLEKALVHLEGALDLSVSAVLENEGAKQEIGQHWEQFLAQFFTHIRTKSKESRMNLLGFISFPRLK